MEETKAKETKRVIELTKWEDSVEKKEKRIKRKGSRD